VRRMAGRLGDKVAIIAGTEIIVDGGRSARCD
jgi:hypothetical protein